jgi:hypothetical protein
MGLWTILGSLLGRQAEESTLHVGFLLAANPSRPSAQTCAVKWPLPYRQQAADV